MNAVEQHKLRWHVAVGRFAVAMGEIERAVRLSHEWLKAPRPKRDDLCHLIEALRIAVARRQGSFESGIESCLDEAGGIRKLRNSVLHSAVSWQMSCAGIPEDLEIEVGPDFKVEDLALTFASTVNDIKRPELRLSLQELI